MTRPRLHRWMAVIVTAIAAGTGFSGGAAALDPAAAVPPIHHVWVINLENTSYRDSFGTPANDPYLATTLPGMGALLRQYYGIGHESLDNYIAEISGQAPSVQTQADCPIFSQFIGSAGGLDGQAVGQGCVYPKAVHTLTNQLEAKRLTWKGYMEDMGLDPGLDGGTRCAHPRLNQRDRSATSASDKYATKHDPFVYFHAIIDRQAYCNAHVVPLTEMPADLQLVSTTPNFSFVTPNLDNDGHDTSVGFASSWLEGFLPTILSSPAFQADGMVVITFDEAAAPIGDPTDTEDFAACCHEIPGPNSPLPGIQGPGGGRVGAIVLSPFVKPGTVTNVPYNHYSLLRSLEDVFRITSGGDDGDGHLGYAGTYLLHPGPGSFGPDVYTNA